MNQKTYNRQIRRSYIRNRYRAICLYLLIVAVFLAVAALYDYRQVLRNMLYAAQLSLFFGALAVWADYRDYRRKCLALFRALHRETDRLRELPEPGNMPERLYQQLVAEEEREKRKLLTRYDERQKEMADYYTMWTHQIKTPIAALRLLLQNEEALSGEVYGKEAGQRAAEEDGAESQEGQAQETRRREAEELFKIEQYAQMALCYARLDSPSSDFLFREYNVYEIVKQAVRKYSVLFLRSGLSFRMEEFTLQAVTDEKWLGFVVEQVFSNALKYTHRGGIAIYGADEAGDPDQGEVSCLVIEDTGIGIRECDLPRIFERGFTGYNGRQDKRSTGLGLYLCERIMSRMSHTMKVRSVLGQGTKVILGFAQPEMESI